MPSKDSKGTSSFQRSSPRTDRVTLSKTFRGGWSVSAAGAGANNDRFYRPPVGGLSYGNGDTRKVNKPVLILQVGRTF